MSRKRTLKKEPTKPNSTILISPEERQLLYMQHRQRVQNAKSLVNSAPPPRKSKGISARDMTFLELLESLNIGNGCSRTFTKCPEIMDRYLHSSINIGSATAALPYVAQRSRSDQIMSTAGPDERKYPKCDIPDHIFQRYEHLTVPRNISVLRKLLRPRIFFDMEVKNVRPLGRLVLQLYTEACPEVVLAFVRACTETPPRGRFRITRLFPPLWFEGALTLEDNKVLALQNIEHDWRVLDHGCSAGILSFPSRYVRGSKRRFLTFSISFKPLSVLNGKRIAFGKVRRGQWLLDIIQDTPTKNGRPLREIVVNKCGILQNYTA